MNTHPSQEAVVEEKISLLPKTKIVVDVGDGERDMVDLEEVLPYELHKILTTYAQTIREEERERIREALNKGYEDTFHWGSGLSEPTHITEKEFGIIVNEALTNKV